MKRLLVLVAVAFGAVALYAMTAPAGQRAVTPGQITALNKKVTALQTTVNKLKECVFAKNHAVAMSEYNGFQYQRSDGSTITTTALATTDQGDTPQFYVLTTTQQCAATTIGIGRAAAPRLGAR